MDDLEQACNHDLDPRRNTVSRSSNQGTPSFNANICVVHCPGRNDCSFVAVPRRNANHGGVLIKCITRGYLLILSDGPYSASFVVEVERQRSLKLRFGSPGC
jgi:hypothetical protein